MYRVYRSSLTTRISYDTDKMQASNISHILILKELVDMRRKVNDLIEIKRRLEEETAALRFSVDNVRVKMEGLIREK